ncbi:MAG TPA: AIPR family protein [Thiobacillaceae bacterium]|nr:AIPR family protein [Thiobacillaceae bacterium]
MVATVPNEKDLQRELSEYHERYPKLGDDELFVLWFLRAFVSDSDTDAEESLCGGSRDKGVDAVMIDDPARIIFIVQGKYRKLVAAKSEQRGDVAGFAQLAVDLTGDGTAFASLAKDMSPEVVRKLSEARNRIIKRAYSLQLLYVTMGKCSAALHDEAMRIVRAADASVSFQLFDGKRAMLLLADYFDGVAPPVPSLDLEIESGSGVKTAGVFNRYDGKTDIESWIFSMTDIAVAGLFERAGTRLFARNVRGFLGSTEINRGMEATLSKESEYFWYYNNGITIVCDDAKQESSRGRNLLRVTNPQVINGQQTTRTLARTLGKSARASVLVRVIRVPREGKDKAHSFETLVSRIVSATNWQNAIRPSDLMSNDRRQIEIERQLRKVNYLYLRKRMTKSEAKSIAGKRHLRLVGKEELAQAVAGCDLDPSIVREGKERLFEERWYGQIFPNSEPRYYLSRYWLMRQVSYVARGYPERAYAKWLVLNLVWTSLDPLCRARTRAEVFRTVCERDTGHVLNPLLRAIDAAYTAALRFYRGKRGTGPTAIDVSTFFQRRNLHKEFQVYWSSSDNKSRITFIKAWAKFKSALERELEG